MAAPILMAALSPTMKTGTINKWLKKEGEHIAVGDIIAEIETDKAIMDLEAHDTGILAKICVAEGTNNVSVNTLIGIIKEKGDDEEAVALILNTHVNQPLKSNHTTDDVTKLKSEPDFRSIKNDSRIFATPLAKKLALENNINLVVLEGSGPHGRIVKNDVLKQTQNVHTKNLLPEAQKIPISVMRRAIAERLTLSKQNIPHFYLKIECIVDKLIKIRSEINHYISQDNKISMNDLIIKSAGIALEKHQEVNSSWQDEYIVQYPLIDIAVAVAVQRGLITPIVRNVQNKNLQEISSEMKILAKRAKEGSLKIDEFTGGTFTITNLGMFGIEEFQAIINPPQAAILAVGACVKKPIFDESTQQFKAHNIITFTLSCDHRVIDGAIAARFISTFRQIIENPALMLL